MAQAGFEPGSVAPESTPFLALTAVLLLSHTRGLLSPQPEDEPAGEPCAEKLWTVIWRILFL